MRQLCYSIGQPFCSDLLLLFNGFLSQNLKPENVQGNDDSNQKSQDYFHTGQGTFTYVGRTYLKRGDDP